MLEDEMAVYCLDFLRKQDFQWVRTEIPFMSRCIDALVLDNSNQLLSIEFKISKWRQAILQASYHKLGSDQAYICLPRKKETDLLRDALEAAGIGLMLYDVDTHEINVVHAPSRVSTVPLFRQKLMETANMIEAVG